MSIFMNEYEVEEAALLLADHPIAGPASKTLLNFVHAVNAKSDGWPFWQPPLRAAARLIGLVDGVVREYRIDRYHSSDDDILAAYRKALPPLKAFRTRMAAKGINIDFEIVEVTR